jgi:hypothetical protein
MEPGPNTFLQMTASTGFRDSSRCVLFAVIQKYELVGAWRHDSMAEESAHIGDFRVKKGGVSVQNNNNLNIGQIELI